MKNVLITGAGSGLGRGTAIGLAQAGHRIFATTQIWPQATELEREGRELDWGEQAVLDGVTFTAAPARHFSGRGVANRDPTLWASWVIVGIHQRVFFCGDSGFFGGFRDIGREHGPFDLTLISAGAYSPTWPLIHMTPEEVIPAHLDLRGQLLLPIHWGTFNLAFHDWNEPAMRASVAAGDAVPRSSFRGRARWWSRHA